MFYCSLSDKKDFIFRFRLDLDAEDQFNNRIVVKVEIMDPCLPY